MDDVAFGMRPELHLSAPRFWLNDPNGLVFHKGRYHAFYQHNPQGVDHTTMSWGHASSADLMTWQDHPVAIPYDDDAAIFSGSIVIDEETFGTPESPALVAIYTAAAAGPKSQAQALAISLDDGETWEKYAHNPVLDRGTTDFRDPKVFRFDDGHGAYWVMAAVEAVERRVLFYRSDDLIDWTYLSSFGPAGLPADGVWECPDLFELGIEHSFRGTWVLLVSVSSGAVAGGSGTFAVFGNFDGVAFRATEVDDAPMWQWLDHGRDNYAGVTFYGADDRILLGWMNNWDYAKDLPYLDSEPRRGAMTLARRLSVVAVQGRLHLRQTPVELPIRGAGAMVGFDLGSEWLPMAIGLQTVTRLDVMLEMRDAARVEFLIRHDDDHAGGVLLSYDAATGDITVDRTAAGEGFPAKFPSVDVAPTRGGRSVEFSVWLDVSSLEVFADEGFAVLTDLIDVPAGRGLAARSIGGCANASVWLAVPVGWPG